MLSYTHSETTTSTRLSQVRFSCGSDKKEFRYSILTLRLSMIVCSELLMDLLMCAKNVELGGIL